MPLPVVAAAFATVLLVVALFYGTVMVLQRVVPRW
jgi:hypothetical protein